MAGEAQALTQSWRTFNSYSGDPLARAVYARGLKQFSFSLFYLAFYTLNVGLVLALYSLFWPAELSDQIAWALRPTSLAYSIILPPLVAGFYHWISDAPRRLISELMNSDVFKNLSEQDQLTLSERLSAGQRLFAEPAWTLVAFSIGFVAMTIGSILAAFGLGAGVAPGEHGWVGGLMFLPAPTLGLYMVVMAVAKEICLITTLGHVFRDVHITLYPWHPDRCGGLRALNDYALKFTYFIGMAGFGLSLLAFQSWRAEGLQTDVLLWIGIGAYAILAPYCFFATLGSAHKTMEKVKSEHLEAVSKRFNDVYLSSHKLLANSTADSLKSQVDEIEQLNRLYQLTVRFPVWPFDWASIRRFVAAVSGSLLPILPILKLMAVEAIKSVF